MSTLTHTKQTNYTKIIKILSNEKKLKKKYYVSHIGPKLDPQTSTL